MSQQAVSAGIIPNSAVGIFSPKIEGTKTKAAIGYLLTVFPLNYFMDLNKGSTWTRSVFPKFEPCLVDVGKRRPREVVVVERGRWDYGTPVLSTEFKFRKKLSPI